MNIRAHTNCCDNLFTEFEFRNLESVQPPDEKGVYVIRIKRRNKNTPKIMIEKTEQLVSGIEWELVKNYIMNRVKRLQKIEDCPIIYIGCAGARRGSKNTIKKRYKEFSTRHTAMCPIWVLIYFGWKLEFGWRIIGQNPKRKEGELKEKYKKMHSGKLPALVKR